MVKHTVPAKQPKGDDVIPRDTADRWERLTKLASERLFGKRKKIMAAVGNRPYQGMPVSEVAATLGIPAGTAHSRLDRAMDKLRLALHADDPAARRAPAEVAR